MQVYVFRFIAENSVEEHMLDRAAQKLRLDQLVFQQGAYGDLCDWIFLMSFSVLVFIATNKGGLVEMIAAGVDKIINTNEEFVHAYDMLMICP
jgi:SWI/SNF-related matrix-associated actin-dependent regulator of chromatin subfamily A member 5